jgi:RNA polymerase sigma-70 factor (ECF subfamily)
MQNAQSIAPSGVNAPSDADLVERIRLGDVLAFELMMRRYNRRLFRIARSILKDPSEAEDAVQDAYLKVFANIGSFTGPDGFSAWICRIVGNEALGRLRQRARVVSLEAYRSTPDGAGLREDDMLKSPEPGPERLAASSELRRALEQAIDALPPDFCAVFMLRAVEGLSVAETSASLGIRPETVKTRFHRARRLLRQHLVGQVDHALPGAFDFAGERCARLVAEVLARIASTPTINANNCKGD